MVILVHLINNWQMNPHRKRTLLAALLLSTACIFSVTSAHADEPQVKDGAAAKPDTVFRDCLDCPEMVVIPAGSFNRVRPTRRRCGPRSTVRHQNQFQMKGRNIG